MTINGTNSSKNYFIFNQKDLENKKSDPNLIRLNEACSTLTQSKLFAGRNSLLALQNLQNKEITPELKAKIIELKDIAERRLLENSSRISSILLNMAFRIFHPQDWHSSEFRILELLKQTPFIEILRSSEEDESTSLDQNAKENGTKDSQEEIVEILLPIKSMTILSPTQDAENPSLDKNQTEKERKAPQELVEACPPLSDFENTKKCIEGFSETDKLVIEALRFTNLEFFELAKILVEKGPAELSNNLEKFDLTKEQLIALINMILEVNKLSSIDRIESFLLTKKTSYKISIDLLSSGKEDRFSLRNEGRLIHEHKLEILKHLLKNQQESLEKNKESALCQDFEKAKILIETDPNLLINNLANLGLTQEQSLVIAKELAKKAPGILASHLTNFDLTKGQISNLASFLIKEDINSSVNQIKDFIRAKQDTYKISISQYSYWDKEDSFCWYEAKEPLFEHFFELTKMLLENKQESIEKSKEYAPSPDFEKAKTLIETDPSSILSLTLTKNERFELACILLGKDHLLLINNIKNFGLTKPQCLSLAKALALITPHLLANNLEKFDLTPGQFSDLANVIIKINKDLSLNRMKNFILTKKYATKAAIDLLFSRRDIQRFVESEHELINGHLFEIVNAILENHKEVYEKSQNKTPSPDFEKAKALITACELTIQDLILTKDEVFELAGILLEKDPVTLVNNVEKFDLSEEHRYELAKKLVIKIPQTFADNLKKFNLIDGQLSDLAGIVLSTDEPWARKQLFQFALTKLPPRAVETDPDDDSSSDCGYNSGDEDSPFSSPEDPIKLLEDHLFEFVTTVLNKYQGVLVKKQKSTSSADFKKAKKTIENFSYSIDLDLTKLTVTNAELFELLKMLLEKKHKTCTECFIKNMENVKLQPKQFLALGDKLFERKSEELAKNIEKFKLEKADLFVFATKLLEKDPKSLATYIEDFKLEKEALLDFATKLLEKAPAELISNISAFKLEKDQLFDFANKLLEKNARNVANEIRPFKLKEDRLFEIAKKIADKDLEGFLYNIENFTSTKRSSERFYSYSNRRYDSDTPKVALSQEQLFEIIKIALEKEPANSPSYEWHVPSRMIAGRIKEFAFKKDQLLEIAKMLLEKNLPAFFGCIKDLQLEEDELFSFANILIEKNPSELAQNIKEFSLRPDRLSRFVKLLAKKAPKALAGSLEHFELTAKDLLGFAKMLAVKYPETLARNLKKFNFKDEQVLYFANIIAEKNPGSLICTLLNFKFKEKQFLHFINIIAEKKPVALADNLEKFTLEKEWLFDFANKCLETIPLSLPYKIKNFGLTKDQLFTFASKLFEKAPRELANCLEYFSLTKPEILVFANKYLENYPSYLDPTIKNFGLKKDQLPDFIKAFSEKAPGEFANCIKEFNFGDKELLEFANRLIEKAPSALAKNIKEFNLKLEKLLEFANILIDKAPDELASSIGEFKLKPKQLLEFAFKLVDKAPENLACNLKHFKLTEEQTFKIARALVVKSHMLAMLCIQDLNTPKNQQQITTLLVLSMINHPTETAEILKGDDNTAKAHVGFSYFLKPEKALDDDRPKLTCPVLNALMEKACREEPREKLILLRWIGYVELCKLFLPSGAELGAQGAIMLEKIFDLRPPALRYKMTKHLFDILATKSLKNYLESGDMQKAFSKESSDLFRLLLTSLAVDLPESIEEEDKISPSSLFAQDSDEIHEEEEAPLLVENPELSDLIKSFSILNLKSYKDVSPRKIVIGSILTLLETSSLTNKEKTKILQMILSLKDIEKIQASKELLHQKNLDLKIALRKTNFDSQKKTLKLRLETGLLSIKLKKDTKSLTTSINKSLQLMEILCNIGEVEKLKEMTTKEELEQTVQNMFAKVTGIGQVENFAEKYLRTFAAARNPESVFIYAGKLKQLPSNEKDEALEALKLYVEGVLNGTLSTLRHEEKTSEDHLSIVFKGRQELKTLWMQGETFNFQEMVSSSKTSSIQKFNAKKQLHQWICLDKHIQVTELESLYKCLMNSSLIKTEIADLHDAIKAEKHSDTLKKLQLQQGLLLLLDESKTNEELSQIFQSLVAPFMDVAFSTEGQFNQDLKTLGMALAGKKPEKEISYEGWTVVDTDDGITLLACGTDVLGSCQNINGTPSLNKCLLGYLLDGKNRLVAVKNERGEIVARAIMRILWDEKAQIPVLFKERMYSAPNIDSKVTEALDEMFIKRSKTLNIPLVTNWDYNTSSAYSNPLRSFGSIAPFEYVDAASGVTDGSYTIDHSTLIQTTDLISNEEEDLSLFNLFTES